MHCPICLLDKCSKIIELDAGKYTESKLYDPIRIYQCHQCGHVFNHITEDEAILLDEYYTVEYAPINIESVNSDGDIPGSKNKNTIERYEQLYSFIQPYLTEKSKILDIGCAIGGLLDYLSNKGLDNLFGIDLSNSYTRLCNTNHDIRTGSSDSIPFNDNSFDIVIMDQVLEHVHDLHMSMKEINRVMVKDAKLCVCVPNALDYNKFSFFDFYWFLMKEHLNHFSHATLNTLGCTTGFTMIEFRETQSLKMMCDDAILPTVTCIFEKSSVSKTIKKDQRLPIAIERYVHGEIKKLNTKKTFFDLVSLYQHPIIAWGIAREFLYLYQAAGLNKCNIVGMIDMNQFKQRNLTVDNMRIMEDRELHSVMTSHPNSKIIITAPAHQDDIKSRVEALGYTVFGVIE